MTSVFLKMFLWFCGTAGAIFVVITAGFLRESPSALVTNWRELGHRAIVMTARESVTIYERGGGAALSRHLEAIREGVGVDAALVEASGAVLGGRVAGLDAEVLRELNTPELTILNRAGLAGVGVRGFVFVVALPPREAGIWGRVFLFSFLIAGCLLCYFLARYVTAPVTHLRLLTRQFSQGDLSARVTAPGILERRDEIGELGRDFNHMASRIDSLMQAQRRLIADVSHELRSPITRLTLALGLMRRRSDAGDPASLGRMGREIERLNSLIGQLLTLSRLEYLDRPGPMEAVDLSALVREIAADADFEAAGVEVHVRLAQCDACTVDGSPELLRSAIENVVRNAVKYTEPKTEVLVSVVRAGPTASVVVQDQGPGLPEAELAHVFEPFYRVDAARERNTGGAGLGLAITQRVARLHGGAVSAANRSEGGLELRVVLPVGLG